MSSLGPIQLEEETSSIFLGRDYNKSRNFSSQVAFEIDKEVRNIISEQYEVTKKIIKENKDLLDTIAKALMEKETLTKEEIDEIVENYNNKGSKKETKKENKEETK
jgi:cell division protease FtsH